MTPDLRADFRGNHFRTRSHDCRVGFRNLAVGKHFAELVHRHTVFRDDETAGSIFVQTMHDAGAHRVVLFIKFGNQIAVAPEQCIDHGSGVVSRGGVNNHPGRLVDDQKRIVFIQNIQRDFLRLHMLHRGIGGRLKGDFIPLRNHRALCSADFAVQSQLAGVDEFLNLNARVFAFRILCNTLVDTDVCKTGFDCESDPFLIPRHFCSSFPRTRREPPRRESSGRAQPPAKE